MSRLTASLLLAAFLQENMDTSVQGFHRRCVFQTAYFSGLVVPGAQSLVFEDFQLVRGLQQRASSCEHTRPQKSGHFDVTLAAA